LFSSLFSQTLDSLLIQYEDTVDQSLKTVNEKLGHVVIYSQEELRLMQYNNLNDILKDFLL
jgi:iron complex outermembrane receptor protein